MTKKADMETPVKYNGPARVTVYENGDVDVRLPRENEGLKLQKVKETQAGSLTRTQGKQPILQLRVKTRADAPDPAADLREECEKLLREIDQDAKNFTKFSSKSKGRWLSHDPDLKIRADTDDATIKIALVLPLGHDYEITERLNSKISQIYQCLVTQRVLLSRLANAAKQPTNK
jgi:hypothetical protein